jgi:hypothetical protein
MRRHPGKRHGEGTAWLVADRGHDDYLCYWFVGTNDGHLLERARVPFAGDAVAWGRLRTARVRIRTHAARTYWAGTGPRPAGFAASWVDTGATVGKHGSPHREDDRAREFALRPA